jgi:DNA (cytosine-5)-methyltransferase 1
LATFHVTGVDNRPQPRYCGDQFVHADALAFVTEHGHDYDAIHASPPCQAYTTLRELGKRARAGAPDLVAATRAALVATGRPYVIENVVGAPLLTTVLLCGSMFGLGVRRHRLFETSHVIWNLRCRHATSPRPLAVYGDHPQQPGDRTYRINRARTLDEGRAAMGIDWMLWPELTQAIPPAYTEYIGRRLIEALP